MMNRMKNSNFQRTTSAEERKARDAAMSTKSRKVDGGDDNPKPVAVGGTRRRAKAGGDNEQVGEAWRVLLTESPTSWGAGSRASSRSAQRDDNNASEVPAHMRGVLNVNDIPIRNRHKAPDDAGPAEPDGSHAPSNRMQPIERAKTSVVGREVPLTRNSIQGLRSALQSRSKLDKSMGWKKWVSKTTGKPYWHNYQTGEMRWDPPDGVEERAASERRAPGNRLGITGLSGAVFDRDDLVRDGGSKTARGRLQGNAAPGDDDADLSRSPKNPPVCEIGTDGDASASEVAIVDGGALKEDGKTPVLRVAGVRLHALASPTSGGVTQSRKPKTAKSGLKVGTGALDVPDSARARSSYLRSSFNGLFEKSVGSSVPGAKKGAAKADVLIVKDGANGKRLNAAKSPSTAGLANTWSHRQLCAWVEHLQEDLALSWQGEREARKQQSTMQSPWYESEVDQADRGLIEVLGHAVMASPDPVRKVAELCKVASDASYDIGGMSRGQGMENAMRIGAMGLIALASRHGMRLAKVHAQGLVKRMGGEEGGVHAQVFAAKYMDHEGMLKESIRDATVTAKGKRVQEVGLLQRSARHTLLLSETNSMVKNMSFHEKQAEVVEPEDERAAVLAEMEAIKAEKEAINAPRNNLLNLMDEVAKIDKIAMVVKKGKGKSSVWAGISEGQMTEEEKARQLIPTVISEWRRVSHKAREKADLYQVRIQSAIRLLDPAPLFDILDLKGIPFVSTSIIDSIAGALLGLGATCAILDPQAVKMGAKFVEYPNPEVRIAAARLLGFVGDHSCILILERLSRDPDKEVRRAMRMSINEIMERRHQKMANSKGGRSRG